MLQTAINRFGGYKHIVYCGEPVTNVEYVSILAWDTKLNVGSVGYLPKREIKHGYPIVLFTQLPNGWLARPDPHGVLAYGGVRERQLLLDRHARASERRAVPTPRLRLG